MPSPESEDETRPAPETTEAARDKSDEPAWPPEEAQPEEAQPEEAQPEEAQPEEAQPEVAQPETSASPAAELAATTTATATTVATDEPVLTKPEELPPTNGDELHLPAAEPKQEMGLSESTLHWLIDGEHPIESVANEPGTAPHYDSRAPVAGRKRTVVVIGSAAIVALVVAIALHGQAARNRENAITPTTARAEPATVLTQRAAAALEQGRAGEALDLANLALGSDARFSDAYIVIGKVQRDTGRLPESRDAYRKYLELAPLGTHAEEARAALATLPP